MYWSDAEIEQLIKQKLIYYSKHKAYRKDIWQHFKREIPNDSLIAKFHPEQLRSRWRKIASKTFLEKNRNLFSEDAKNMVLVIKKNHIYN